MRAAACFLRKISILIRTNFTFGPRASCLGVCPRFSIRESRGGSFVIHAVNGATDLGWEAFPKSLGHREVVSVGRFHNAFHQERACYP